MNLRSMRRGLLCLLLLVVGWQALATSVIPMNLADLVQRSQRVFEGTCIKISYGTVKDVAGTTDIPVVHYTFQVRDDLKGVAAQTLILSHLDRFQDGRTFFVKPEMLGLPSYQIGAHYLLFLNQNTGNGLCAPMGMIQGVFEIDDHSAKNLAGNAHILEGMHEALANTAYANLGNRPLAAKDGQSGLPLDELKALVRDLMSGKVSAPSLQELRQ